MPLITTIYQQSIQSNNLTASSESTSGSVVTGIRAGVGATLPANPAIGPIFLAGSAAVLGGRYLKKAVDNIRCGIQNAISNRDLQMSQKFYCDIAIAAAAVSCTGTPTDPVVDDSIRDCVAPKAPISRITSWGSDADSCDLSFECGCPSDDENDLLDRALERIFDSADPEGVANPTSFAECQRQAAKEYAESYLASDQHKNTIDNINTVLAENFNQNPFMLVEWQQILEQMRIILVNTETDLPTDSLTGLPKESGGKTYTDTVRDGLNVLFSQGLFFSPMFRFRQRLIELIEEGNIDALANFDESIQNLVDELTNLIIDIQGSCALNTNIDANMVETFLRGIVVAKEKTCTKDSGKILNEETCECECPEGKIVCPVTGVCVDECPEGQELVAKGTLLDAIDAVTTFPIPGNGYSCSCECPEGTRKLGDTCIPECPNNTTFTEVPCSESHTWVVATYRSEGGGFFGVPPTIETKCYDCLCAKRTGVFPFLNVETSSAFSCEEENQVRRSDVDCECDCDRDNGYIRVWKPGSYSTPPNEGNHTRCRLPCPAGKVYSWSRDECVCEQRLSIRYEGPDWVDVVIPGIELCDEDKVWDENTCQCVCPTGADQNIETGECNCPPGTYLSLEDGACLPTEESGSGSGSGSGFPAEWFGSGNFFEETDAL